MNFEFRISKWANFYYFVQNLSEWHFSNRKDYNIFWREKLEPFSKNEEVALKKLKEIRLKYPRSKSCFEKAFFLSEHPLEELKNCLSKKDHILVEEIFDILKNKFDVLYKEEFPLLEKWHNALSEKAKDHNLITEVFSALNTLYKSGIKEKKILVSLLLSTYEHVGGGANIDSDIVSLEVSRSPLEKINQAMGIIWHETIHLIFQDQFFSVLMDYFKDDEQTATFINELTAGALFPGGILGIRLLKNKPTAQLLPQVTKEQTVMIIDLVKEYIDQRNQLDLEFIERLIKIIGK